MRLLFHRSITSHVCLRLLKLCLKGKRINLKKKLVLLHALAVPNVHADKLARYTRFHGHAGIGFNVAYCAYFDRKILSRNNRGAHCCGRPTRGGGFRRAGWGLRTGRKKDHGQRK